MTIDTRFGSFPAAEYDVINIPGGVPAFEGCTRYVLVGGPDIRPFACLQGLESPRPSFLVIDPHLVVSGYRMALSPMDYRRLDAAPGDPLQWLVVVRLGSAENSSVNLRAPFLVNPRRMLAIQALPHDSAYRHDHPFWPEAAHAGLHP